MKTDFDPRTKILIVIALTGVIVINSNLIIQCMLVSMITIMSLVFGVEILSLIKKLRRFLLLLFGLVIIQSLFVKGGTAYIQLGQLTLLTEKGLLLALGYIMRVFSILLSGAIISTSSMRNNIQGLVQLGLPYELGLMTTMGVRFLPVMMEEVSNAYTSMELRGINIDRLGFKRRINLIGRLFIPIVYSAMVRSRRLSESIEMRGFVVGEKRSSYLKLHMKGVDYVLIAIVYIATFIVILL